MTIDIAVLGSGYGGTAAIKSLEEELGDNEEVSLTWVSKEDFHFVLHESHRLIRDADVRYFPTDQRRTSVLPRSSY